VRGKGRNIGLGMRIEEIKRRKTLGCLYVSLSFS
jgi:hypothetical protein